MDLIIWSTCVGTLSLYILRTPTQFFTAALDLYKFHKINGFTYDAGENLNIFLRKSST